MVIRSDYGKERLVEMVAILDFAFKKHVPDRSFLELLFILTQEGTRNYSWKNQLSTFFVQVYI